MSKPEIDRKVVGIDQVEEARQYALREMSHAEAFHAAWKRDGKWYVCWASSDDLSHELTGVVFRTLAKPQD